MTPQERIDCGRFTREVMERISDDTAVLRHGRLVGTVDMNDNTTVAVFEWGGARSWVRTNRALFYPLARAVAGLSGFSSPIGFHYCYTAHGRQLVTLDKAETCQP